jgi:hypothetical protein
MLNHFERTKKANAMSKSIVLMDSVLSLYMHNAEFCLNKKLCPLVWTSQEDSMCFHFRDDSECNPKKEGDETVVDKTMLKYSDELSKNVKLAMNETGL